ncbi:MAG TPA: choice-of-anchor Q domain-containing protein, partial [Roseiflexaceae bacterium]|nr:choice-of-anchor Q domain-containing protein [Roseiflexaceae bacterium]
GSGSGGGVRRHAGSATIGNTLITGNTVSGGTSMQTDISSAFTSAGYNLIGDGTGGTGFNAPGDQVGTSANPIDPLLGPLADNGGPTRTHALLVGSPAIDAGNPAPVGDGGGACPPNDQRGFGRVGRCDIGAYEFGSMPLTNTTTTLVSSKNPVRVSQ